MNGAALTSYSEINSGLLEALNVDKCCIFSGDNGCVTSAIDKHEKDPSNKFNSTDISASVDGLTNNVYAVASQSFDEEYEVTDAEEIKTPRVPSPTLTELKKKLDLASRSFKAALGTPTFECSRIESQFHKKILAEVTSKPCPYAIDKFYDECVPVKSRLRAMRGSILPNGDKHYLSEKSNLVTSPLSPHNPIRLLENMLPCPPPSPLPRQTYSSSSGSLISSLADFSFQTDALVISEALLSVPLTSKFPHYDEAVVEKEHVLDDVLSGADSQIDKMTSSVSVNFSNGQKDDIPIVLTKEIKEIQVSTTQSVTNHMTNGHFDTNSSVNQDNHIRSTNRHRRSSNKKSIKRIPSLNNIEVANGNVLKPEDSLVQEKESLFQPSPESVILNGGYENGENDNLVVKNCLDLPDSSECDSHLSFSNSESNLFSINGTTVSIAALQTSANNSLIMDGKSENCNDHLLTVSNTNSDAIADEHEDEFTLVTNKKIRRKQNSKSTSDKAFNNHTLNGASDSINHFNGLSSNYLRKLQQSPTSNTNRYNNTFTKQMYRNNESKTVSLHPSAYSFGRTKPKPTSHFRSTLPKSNTSVIAGKNLVDLSVHPSSETIKLGNRKTSSFNCLHTNSDLISKTSSTNLSSQKNPSTQQTLSDTVSSQPASISPIIPIVNTNDVNKTNERPSQINKKPTTTASDKNNQLFNSCLPNNWPNINPKQHQILTQFFLSTWSSFTQHSLTNT